MMRGKSAALAPCHSAVALPPSLITTGIPFTFLFVAKKAPLVSQSQHVTTVSSSATRGA